jgi:hypothetical protein
MGQPLHQHPGRPATKKPTRKNQNLIFRPTLTKPLKNQVVNPNIFPLWDDCEYESKTFEPFSVCGVWNNRTYYNLSLAIPNQFSEAVQAGVPHGFIDESDEGNVPRYEFIGNNWNLGAAGQARVMINAAFREWSSLEAGTSPVSGLPLITGLDFDMVTSGDAEIKVYWGGNHRSK